MNVGFNSLKLPLSSKSSPQTAEYFAKADPNDPYVWYYQAVAQEAAGDRKLAMALYLKVTSWIQLDDTGYSMVRSRAIARGMELAKLPN